MRVPRAAQAPVHRIPHPPSPGGTSSPPRARAYPSTALSPSRGQCTRFRSGLATHGVVRDDFWLYQYVLIETVPTRPSSSSPASALAVGFRVERLNQVSPPLLTATLCPDRGTSKPSCTPSRVPRAAQAAMHRMPHSLSPGSPTSPLPEHAHTHRLPCRPHMAGAYVSGPGWRLPGCEKTFFGAISTCAPASFQRCHAQVRLLPCAVASCCLLWCLAVWPVRG